MKKFNVDKDLEGLGWALPRPGAARASRRPGVAPPGLPRSARAAHVTMPAGPQPCQRLLAGSPAHPLGPTSFGPPGPF